MQLCVVLFIGYCVTIALSLSALLLAMCYTQIITNTNLAGCTYVSVSVPIIVPAPPPGYAAAVIF